MEKGMVSITIPVYNRQAYIAECVQSIYNQTYQNFEIIILDDGSTDGTFQICRELAQKDSRIKLLQGEHKGVSAARNLTLEEVSGEYVFFLDSDDVIHPRLLETFVNALEQTGAVMAGTIVNSVAYTVWDKVYQHIEKQTKPGETAYYNHADTMQKVFSEKTPFGNIGGVMMRSQWIGQTRFRTDLYIGEDFFFIYENLIKGADTVFLKQKWYYARIHAQNTSNSFNFDGFWTRFLRRKLVWESELASGRKEYADKQKNEAISIYYKFLRKSKMDKAEKKKMIAVTKQHEKVLLEATTVKAGLLLRIAIHMPGVFLIYDRIRKGKAKQDGVWDQEA